MCLIVKDRRKWGIRSKVISLPCLRDAANFALWGERRAGRGHIAIDWRDQKYHLRLAIDHNQIKVQLSSL